MTDRRRMMGKLLVVGAGTGCLVLATFALPPRLAQPPAPQQVTVSEGIDAPAPSRVVGVRDNGEEVAVVFPVAAGGDAARGAQGEAPADAVESLPPALSAEHVAAAMDGLDAGGAVEPEEHVDETERSAVEALGPAADGRTAAGDLRGDAGGRRAEAQPPPSATRDVQELLAALGYAPGPADGIWGERTEAAWRRFARDAAGQAGRTRLAEAQREQAAEPESVADPPAAAAPTPSGAAVEAGERGAGQAGNPRPQAGLPPREAVQPVVVPGTLRGVTGYRMPLVSRQGVPDQVVSGVLIPAHTTFVILKPGHWELVGLRPGEVERLRRPAAPEPAAEAGPARRGWNPLRLFWKRP